jgi:hypothetical protein
MYVLTSFGGDSHFLLDSFLEGLLKFLTMLLAINVETSLASWLKV